MKAAFSLFFILFISVWASAAQKAKIIGDVVEIYSEADFDSEIFDEVYKDEVYQISQRKYGEAFYRIRLKSGKIGYIVDYQLNIEGKGPLRPRDLDELELEAAKEQLAKAEKEPTQEKEESPEMFGKSLGGPSFWLVNYHEETMGREQIDDLMALGYRSVGLMSWSVMGAWQAPDYYSAQAGYSAEGFMLWGDFGISNAIGQFSNTDIRVGAALFTHISSITVETPARRYSLQDMTLGLNLELGVAVKWNKWASDLSMKYFFDKSNYAAVGLSFLF